ncbi:MAG: hypothetical protein GF401_15295 [Chitinivibrionales bacterium]|nr:hypothetical protein [Chitinivibrionales bacterium]
MQKFLSPPSVLLWVLLIVPLSYGGKSRTARSGESRAYTSLLATRNARAIRQFESKLRPYFEIKAGIRRDPSDKNSIYRPSQSDLYMLAKTWNLVSSEFKSIYLKSIQIPEEFLYYTSPSGHFEVYYTVTDPQNAVDPADQYGFDQSNWRNKINAPNGIPDYIDEVAWALDSSWSMEIDRFGFPRPYPSDNSSGTPNIYKVVVKKLVLDDYYGQTFHGGAITHSGKGYTSVFELRNEWESPTWKNTYMDYNTYPEQGIRVTCAHEFFHAIQYAMSWRVEDQVYLDDFPLAWIEGSAVLMEELAFEDIDDYIQYSKDYFYSPTIPMLRVNNYDDYFNVFLMLYLYNHTTTPPSIDFIKTVFDNNYAGSISFHSNLQQTSESLGFVWNELLGDFYVATYFTGTRADPVLFIEDADLLPEWTTPNDAVTPNRSVTKIVQPYGMNIFSFESDTDHYPEMEIHFGGKDSFKRPLSVNDWAVHALLTPRETTNSVEIQPIEIAGNGAGKLFIENRQLYSDIKVIATNGINGDARYGTVTFMPCSISHFPGDTVFSQTTSVKAPGVPPDTASLYFVSRDTLRCSMSITPYIPSSSMKNETLLSNRTSLDQFYEITFPNSWIYSFDTLHFDLQLTDDNFLLYNTTRVFTPADYMLFIWDDSAERWEPVTTGFSSVTGSYNWYGTLNSPGIYGLFARETRKTDIVVYPNPVHRSEEVAFEGEHLSALRIYQVDGKLVFHARRDEFFTPPWYNPRRDTYIFRWDLLNHNNNTVAPGTYIIFLEHTSRTTGETSIKKKSLLVLP